MSDPIKLSELRAAPAPEFGTPPRRITDAELTAQQAGYHDFNAIESMACEIRARRWHDPVVDAAPVLLEIVEAALALKQAGQEGDEVIRMMGVSASSDEYSAACTLAPRVEERRRAALSALDAALAKVQP